jgi:hypothetical protein
VLTLARHHPSGAARAARKEKDKGEGQRKAVSESKPVETRSSDAEPGSTDTETTDSTEPVSKNRTAVTAHEAADAVASLGVIAAKKSCSPYMLIDAIGRDEVKLEVSVTMVEDAAKWLKQFATAYRKLRTDQTREDRYRAKVEAERRRLGG